MLKRLAEPVRELLELPLSLRLAAIFYLLHILCQGWIGSSEGFLILGVISAAVALRRRQLRLAWDPLYLPLAMFVLASLLSALASPRPLRGIAEIGEIYLFLTFPLAISLYSRVSRLRELALGAFITLAATLAVYGLIQYFFLGYTDLEHRIRGMTAHVMTYSGILLPLALLMLVLLLARRSVPIALVFLASSLALVFTFTRGAWIGWGIGFIALALLRSRSLALAAVPLLLVALVVSPLALFGRLVSTFDLEQASNLDRVRMLQAGIEIVRDYPITGVGPGNIKEIYPLYRLADAPRFRIPHLHNNVIQIWAERGVLALVSYLALVALFVVRCWSVPRGDDGRRLFADFGIAAALGLAAAGLFEFNFGDSEVLLNMLDLFALVVAMTVLPGTVRTSETNSAAAPAVAAGV